MIFNLYNISCKYVKPMNCMVLGIKQYNLIEKVYPAKCFSLLCVNTSSGLKLNSTTSATSSSLRPLHYDVECFDYDR